MSKRRWKQFFYGLVFFLIFFALIGLVAFKWNGSKVCLTQAQRNQVAGVGCSGSCQTCQTAMARIKIESANVILYADGTMDLYAQVSDRDQSHGLKNFSYQFLVQGNQPNQAEVFAGQSYVFPSEQKYVIESNLKQPNFFVAKVSFNLNFNQADWLPLASANSNVAINLLNSQFKNKTLSFEVSNGGSIVYKKINLNFLILDKNNNIIGTAKSYLDQLQPLGRYQGILNLPPLSGQPVNLIFQPDSNLYTD
ncbi:hypothetical protein M1525_01340 [Patescibacteria group bacterium]|nr:hypothetical protein [Patescibacteria group bacterium]